MEISIKRRDFFAIIDLLKSTKNPTYITLLSKHVEESEGFRTDLIEYLKTICDYQDLTKLINKLANTNAENPSKMFSLCKIIEKLILDSDSKFKNNVFLQSILLTSIMLVFYEDKKFIFRDKLVGIFLKIKILSKDEITILEKIRLFYLLGFYYFKNTSEFEAAVICFKKAGLVDNDPILLELESLIQLKNESEKKITEKSHLDASEIKHSDNVFANDINKYNNNDSMVEAAGDENANFNSDMEIENPEDFLPLEISPLFTGKKEDVRGCESKAVFFEKFSVDN